MLENIHKVEILFLIIFGQRYLTQIFHLFDKIMIIGYVPPERIS